MEPCLSTASQACAENGPFLFITCCSPRPVSIHIQACWKESTPRAFRRKGGFIEEGWWKVQVVTWHLPQEASYSHLFWKSLWQGRVISIRNSSTEAMSWRAVRDGEWDPASKTNTPCINLGLVPSFQRPQAFLGPFQNPIRTSNSS